MCITLNQPVREPVEIWDCSWCSVGITCS